MSTYDSPAYGAALTRDQTRGLFGQVMGLVAVTVGFAALGAYVGRNLSGGTGILFFIAAFACIFGLNIANSRGRQQVAMALLFALGLALGLAVAPIIAVYAHADPAALWQAAGATGAFVAGCGAFGYATRRDLSAWYRILFWALLALIVFGLVTIFISIPQRQHHLRRARPGDLRRLHDHRLQSPAAGEQLRRDPDRGRHLPRHLQRLPVLPAAVRERTELTSAPRRTFALQFPARQIEALAGRFPGSDDEARLALGAAVRARGYYTREEFIEVCAWKTVRSRPKVAANTEAAVVDATGRALAAGDEATRIAALLELEGVGVPTASTSSTSRSPTTTRSSTSARSSRSGSSRARPTR